MPTLKQLRSINTPDELVHLIGQFDYDNGRGGYLGYSSKHIADLFNISIDLLPRKFGVYYNYLGGGVCGALQLSTFGDEVGVRKAKLLTELTKACKRVCEYLEGDENDEGEVNWDAVATKAARKAGIVSAY